MIRALSAGSRLTTGSGSLQKHATSCSVVLGSSVSDLLAETSACGIRGAFLYRVLFAGGTISKFPHELT